jgi:catalase
MFLVVDVQNDFISGTLNISHCSARQNGAEVRQNVKRLGVLKKTLVPGCASSQHYTAVLAGTSCLQNTQMIQGFKKGTFKLFNTKIERFLVQVHLCRCP